MALSYSGFGYPLVQARDAGGSGQLGPGSRVCSGLAYANSGASLMNKIAVTRTRELVELTVQRQGGTLVKENVKKGRL